MLAPLGREAAQTPFFAPSSLVHRLDERPTVIHRGIVGHLLSHRGPHMLTQTGPPVFTQAGPVFFTQSGPGWRCWGANLLRNPSQPLENTLCDQLHLIRLPREWVILDAVASRKQLPLRHILLAARTCFRLIIHAHGVKSLCSI